MGRRKTIYFGCLGMALVSTVIGIAAGPIMNKRVINSIEFADGSLFYSALVLLIITTVLSWAVFPVSCYFAAWASKKAMLDVRSRLAGHIVKLPSSYYDTHAKGETLSLLSNDLDCLETVYDGQFYKTMENFCVGFTGLVMLFVIDWRLAIAASALGFLSTWIAGRYGAPIADLGKRLQDSSGKTTTVFLDILKGVRTVKLFNLGALMGEKLFRSASMEADLRIRLSDRQAEMNAIVGLMNGLSSFGIIIIGAFMVNAGLTDWGSVIVVSTLQFATGDLFSLFPMSLANMQASLSGVQRILQVLDTPVETMDERRYRFVPADGSGNVLELRNVTFGYSREEPFLKGISLSLKQGEITALTGESGGGKSTLVKLILGLYAPSEGVVTLQSDEYEVSASSWRNQIAYVPQQPYLFSGTIAENIAFGSEEAGADEIESAARAAGIHEFLAKLPNGYQTVLAEDGSDLSGGQKQRIAIARALLKKADVLLLDELTASLDGDNEALIMQSIRKRVQDRGILVVTHRETTASFADRIYKLQSGVLTSVR